jgi:hypothetical protein
VGEADHAEARLEERVEIGRLALHRVGAFGAEQGTHDLRVVPTPLEQVGEVGEIAHQQQSALRRLHERPQPVRLIECPAQRSPPGAAREPCPVGQGEQVDAGGLRAVDVDAHGHDGHGGEDLERDPALA